MKNTFRASAGWFYLEPYVYTEVVPGEALLLNTLDNHSIHLTASELIKLVAQLGRPSQCGVVKVSRQLGATALFQTFLQEVRGKFMGDLLDLATYPVKPVQPLPLLPVIHDVRKRQFGDGESYFSYLHELTIHLDTQCTQSCSDCFLTARQSGGCTTFPAIGSNRIIDILERQLSPLHFMSHLYGIQLVATHCFETERGSRICKLLHDFRDICRLKIHAVHLPTITAQAREFFGSEIMVLAEVNTPLPAANEEAFAYTWIFLVRSTHEYQLMRKRIESLPEELPSYRFFPVYTGWNDDFFREKVYVNPAELLQGDHSMQSIHRNGLLNSYFFGRLTLSPDGAVRTHLGAAPLGNLQTHSWETLLRRAFSRKDSSWFRIRGRQACRACLYKNLCPPLSAYEEVMGQSCLCTQAIEISSPSPGIEMSEIK